MTGDEPNSVNTLCWRLYRLAMMTETVGICGLNAVQPDLNQQITPCSDTTRI